MSYEQDRGVVKDPDSPGSRILRSRRGGSQFRSAQGDLGQERLRRQPQNKLTEPRQLGPWRTRRSPRTHRRPRTCMARPITSGKPHLAHRAASTPSGASARNRDAVFLAPDIPWRASRGTDSTRHTTPSQAGLASRNGPDNGLSDEKGCPGHPRGSCFRCPRCFDGLTAAARRSDDHSSPVGFLDGVCESEGVTSGHHRFEGRTANCGGQTSSPCLAGTVLVKSPGATDDGRE